MKITREELSKTQIKLTITVTPEEQKSHLEHAAKHISEHVKVAGFRPGKATYDAVVNSVGEMKVMEEAIDPMVREFLVKAADQEAGDTVGMPAVNVEKMVPGNDVVFTAIFDKRPAVTKLGAYKKLKVDAESTDVKDEQVDKALDDLVKMQRKEVRADKDYVVTTEDLAVVDMTMKRDGVPIEGGTGTDYRVYMTEDFYLPGLKEEIVGTKEGEEKSFKLTMPEEYANKELVGQEIEFDLHVKEVFTLDAPEMNDEFAKTVGLESEKELREKIAENIKAENDDEERARQERELFELLVSKSKFEEIPEGMISREIDQMMQELEGSITQRGADFAQYLTSIKRTREQLREDMKEKADTRVKVSLVIREVAKQEGIEITPEDAQAEIEKEKEQYKGNEHAMKMLESPNYQEYKRHIMLNQKVAQFLRDTMVK